LANATECVRRSRQSHEHGEAAMKKLAVLTVCCCAISAPAAAWDGFGHMEVAAVAWSKLTPAVRARAAELLRLNPMHHRLVADAPPAQRDQFAFIRAATWPDLIKHTHGYSPDGPAHGDRPPPGPEASQNIGYPDHFMHKYWHFIDQPFSPDGTPLVQPESPNAETQIAKFRAALSSNVSDDIKSYDLAWLLHLVGDVHQPLHATSRFTHAHPDGDNGGNLVPIDCGCSAIELHAFWDGVLGSSENPQDAIHAASQLAVPDASLAAIADEKVWIKESFEAAKKHAYAAPIGVTNTAVALTDAYHATALEVAKERVALAGARLAKLLEDALK
jgi:S1/P1 Nuclease